MKYFDIVFLVISICGVIAVAAVSHRIAFGALTGVLFFGLLVSRDLSRPDGAPGEATTGTPRITALHLEMHHVEPYKLHHVSQ